MESWSDPQIQLGILEARARHAIGNLGELVTRRTPWRDLNMECVGVTRAHVDVFLLRTFVNAVATSEESIKPVLTKLCRLVREIG
jgi:Acyl-CoA oxidase